VDDPTGDSSWIKAVSSDMRVLYAPRLTESLLNSLEPRTVLLHDTQPRSLGSGDKSADWPYPWLSDGGKRYTISLHSKAVPVLVPADLDVFANQSILKPYQVAEATMQRYGVLTDTAGLPPMCKERDDRLKSDFYPCFMRAVLGAVI
jgi:hypothetical protein